MPCSVVLKEMAIFHFSAFRDDPATCVGPDQEGIITIPFIPPRAQPNSLKDAFCAARLSSFRFNHFVDF